MTTELTEPKWKKFERLVYDIQKELAGDAQVTLNDHIEGIDSKTPRQIDISIRRNIGQYAILIVVDCKDYAEPLDVNSVEQFAGLTRDVRANKGAMVSASGFSAAALEYAKAHGIDTFRVVDTESVDWRSYASLPTLLVGTRVKAFGLTFRSFEYVPPLPADFGNLYIFSEDGIFMGTVQDILAERWNSQAIPHEAGEHSFSLGDSVRCESAGTQFRTGIEVNVIVERRYFFGP